MTRKQQLCRIAADELDEMLKAAANSRKRKSDATAIASPPQRQRIASADGTEASTTGLFVSSFIMTIILIQLQDQSYSLNESLRLGHDNHFSIRSSEFPTDFMTNNEFYCQYTESAPRAAVFSTRTMDWQQPALLYQGLHQSHIHDSNPGLMALYKGGFAIGPDNDGSIQTM